MALSALAATSNWLASNSAFAAAKSLVACSAFSNSKVKPSNAVVFVTIASARSFVCCSVRSLASASSLYFAVSNAILSFFISMAWVVSPNATCRSISIWRISRLDIVLVSIT